MDFLSKHKKDIAAIAFFVLIVVEIIFIFRPFVSSPVKGTYSCSGEYIRLDSDTYVTGRQKGFYYFYSGNLNWERDEYGYAAIVLDNGDIYGIKSAFALINVDTCNTLISGRAVFIQALIAAAFFVSVYIAFIDGSVCIVRKKRERKQDDDDDFDISRLKGWKEP